MPIPKGRIIMGQCYETALSRIRRVVAIANNRVTYEEYAATTLGGESVVTATIAVDRFARDVSREVPCATRGGHSM